jgi:methionyl-tRNA formyltransferase
VSAQGQHTSSAVVFAYHNVGVRCLGVLLAHGIDVRLVVTHEDSPGENIWFASVAALARERGIDCIAPPDPNAPDVVARVSALAPDFIFSFYYRQMLKPALLAIPPRGALNMHGSLLPRYRGRVPVNWAVLHGERETGATLHYMTAKPDDGDIVLQTAVPIGADETAAEVFDKVTDAAAATLERALPLLVAGTAPRVPQGLARGSYFGGRKPEDGRIDWSQPARRIHDLVRAVAPPFPGAFTDVGAHRLAILRTRVVDEAVPHPAARLVSTGPRAVALCRLGTLELLDATLDGQPAAAPELLRALGPDVPLGDDAGSASGRPHAKIRE